MNYLQSILIIVYGMTTVFVVDKFILMVASLPAISPTNQQPFNLQLITKSKELNSLRGRSAEFTESPEQVSLDIKTTIEQVQKMLELDPNLPRLTRGEIEDLFEQVTREEYEKSLKVGDVNRAKHMRALMLVLPFNTDNSSADNLQEIYTRPPITKVIPSGEVKPQKEQITVVPSGKVEIVSVSDENLTNMQASPTTYKPALRKKVIRKQPKPTTYHPNVNSVKGSLTNAVISTVPSKIASSTVLPFEKHTKSTTNRNSNNNGNNKYSSHYNAKKTDFGNKQSTEFARRQAEVYTKTTAKPKITPELEEILESLGFAAQSQSKKRFKLDDPPKSGPYSRPVISSIIRQDTGIDEDDDFVPISQPLSLSGDDFRKPLVPQTRADDYVAFKPLSLKTDNSDKINPELEDYLKMFGLVEGVSSRSQKSLNLNKRNKNTTTTVSSPLKIDEQQVSLTPEKRIKRIDTNFDDSAFITKSLNPATIDEIDYQQLRQLLNNIRKLQELNISLTEDSLKSLDLKNYNLSESLLSQGPDPIAVTELEGDDPQKNEVKRQSDDSEPTRISLGLNLDATIDDDDDVLLSKNTSVPSSFSSTSLDNPASVSISSSSSSTTTQRSTTITTSSTAAPSTTTQISRSDSNLGDSFNGPDPVTQEPLPPPRKNGFYFFADINSFLEVGDGDEQVVVKFNPKVGDPGRFIAIEIPQKNPDS